MSSASGSRPSGPPAPTSAALLAECARRSAVCWLSWAAGPAGGRLVWHSWHADALVILDGDDQRLEGLADSGRGTVTLRSKDTGGAVVTSPVRVEVVGPDDPSWAGHADALLAARLNLADPSGTRERWRREARILRLVAEEATALPTTLTV